VPANGYLTFERDTVGFGYGGSDSATLRDANGVELGSHQWTAHASTSFGRCPDDLADFAEPTTITKNAENDCVPPAPWPGGSTAVTVDEAGTFGENLSGLDYQASGSATPGVLWASKNGPGTLYRLTWNGSAWTPDTANDWTNGKTLEYPDGSGDVDAEGVTFANDATSVFIGSERNNSVDTVSRNSVLKFDATTPGTTLVATTEWNLTSGFGLPTTEANRGIEAITWIADSVLVAGGFVDLSGQAYDPTDFTAHSEGVFFIGIEESGGVYAYVLEDDGGATLIATIERGFGSVMALEYDDGLDVMWVVCDDGCDGRALALELDPTGAFTVFGTYERPASLLNTNNEGFAVAPFAECVNDERPAIWADDDQAGGNALRQGTMTCNPLAPIEQF